VALGSNDLSYTSTTMSFLFYDRTSSCRHTKSPEVNACVIIERRVLCVHVLGCESYVCPLIVCVLHVVFISGMNDIF
jgi:hypothetical protein